MHKENGRFAKLITIFLFIIVAFGLIMLSSSGIADGQRKFDSPYYFVLHQMLYGFLPGLALFLFFSKISYKNWRKFGLFAFIVAVVLLVMIFIPSFGVNLKGAHRWLNFGLFQFQPSEFLKFALILYLAAWFSSRDRNHEKVILTLVPLILILVFISSLLILQPDLGTLGIVVIIAIAMYFFAGAKIKHFAGLGVLFLSFMLILALVAPYRSDRLKAFISPTEDTLGVAYHINQALIGIGSGGVFGVGFGQSRQKQAYLPEPVGDSIFAIITEEIGFLGAAILILLYLVLITVMIFLALRVQDSFGRLLVLGASVWLASQFFINVASISGIIPLTGVPLPLISQGSSSLVALMSMFGIVVNIAKQS